MHQLGTITYFIVWLFMTAMGRPYCGMVLGVIAGCLVLCIFCKLKFGRFAFWR